jgi:hypothetical protein
MSAPLLPVCLSILAVVSALPALAQGIEVRSASVTLSYEDGTEGNGLPVGRAGLGIDMDLGFGDRFGIEAGLGLFRNDASGGFAFEYEGKDLFLNPYWQASDSLRIGLFYDKTWLSYGVSTLSSDLYGVTVAYAAPGGMMIDGYLGKGNAQHDLDATAVGVALNYDFGNGWALGGHIDHEVLTGFSDLEVTRFGVTSSYTFQGQIPVTVTFGGVYEDTFEDDTRFGLELSIPIGRNPGPARPADPRRGIVGGRPLT